MYAKHLDSAAVNDDKGRGQTVKIAMVKPHDVCDPCTGQVLHRAAENTAAVKLQVSATSLG